MPFAKPHYVSHSIGDHTSILALIEERFVSAGSAPDHDANDRQHLTLRDQYANTLEDVFEFENAPSLNTPVGMALPLADDCTPVKLARERGRYLQAILALLDKASGFRSHASVSRSAVNEK